MSTTIKVAGERLPVTVARAFREAQAEQTPGGAWAYHNGILAAAVIGALRKRGFLTPGHETMVIGCQRRTISLLTVKGREALFELHRRSALLNDARRLGGGGS